MLLKCDNIMYVFFRFFGGVQIGYLECYFILSEKRYVLECWEFSLCYVWFV